MASLQRELRVATLILRALTLILLVAYLAVIATAKIYAPGADVVEPPYITFMDYYAYRYVLYAGAIGGVYTLLLIPFVWISVARRRMIGGSQGRTMFLIFADIVVSVLIATGAAAGLGLAIESQRYEKSFDSHRKRFFHSVDASCGLLLVATVCMVIMVMISVHSLTK